MVQGINRLYGWPIEKEWLLNYSKSHGVDFGVVKGLTTAAAVDNLEQESGCHGLQATGNHYLPILHTHPIAVGITQGTPAYPSQ